VTTLLEAGSRTLKNIDTLEVRFQRQVRGWVNEMVASKITPLIYCGRRTMEEQAALYAKGRTKQPGKIVTKAKPGQSYHNYGLAFDWVPLKAAAKNKDLLYGRLGQRHGVPARRESGGELWPSRHQLGDRPSADE
jgi:hypothetical protein